MNFDFVQLYLQLQLIPSVDIVDVNVDRVASEEHR